MTASFIPTLFSSPQRASDDVDFNVIGGEIFATFSPWASWLNDGNPYAPTTLLPGTADTFTFAVNSDSFVAVTSGGITINLLYDTAALNAPQSFRDGIQQAVAIMAAAISDKITVNIKIDYSGTGHGAAAGPDHGIFQSYSSIRADLTNNATPGDTTFNALAAGSSIQGQSNVAVWNAQLKLWGLLGANDLTTDDGSATFATDIDPNLLVGVALHELTHAMGRVPYGPQPDIFDLFRFTGAGTRLFQGGATAPAAYFSLDGGNSKVADYGRTSDASDFLNSGVQGATDPFNEFYNGGTLQQLTAADLKQLVALGFHLAVPDTVAPALVHDSVLSLAAGGTATIAASQLQFDDNASPHPQEIYNVVTGPTHGTLLKSGSATTSFTQADIDSGLIAYHETGHLASPDSFSFKVMDAAGNTTGTTSFQLDITGNHAPLVVAHDFSVAAGHAISAAQMISVTDPDNDPITQYAFYDTGAGGGHFVINGQPLAAGQWGGASSLAAVNYVGGSSPGSEVLYFSASDGQTWPDAATTAAATTTANHAPLVVGHDISVATGHSIAAAQMISVTDPDNDPIMQYAFYDTGAGGGHFVINGQPLAAGQWGSASSLAAVNYVGGSSPGSEVLYFSASDGQTWPDAATTAAATTTANHAPLVVAQDFSVATGHAIAAAQMISVTDPDNDPITQYAFYDTGAGGGHFVINGQPLAAGQWGGASSLAAVNYVGGSSPGSEVLYFSASDGQTWPDAATTAAATTTLSNVAEVELLHQHDWLI